MVFFTNKGFKLLLVVQLLWVFSIQAQREAPSETIKTLFNSEDFEDAGAADNSGITQIGTDNFTCGSCTSGSTSNSFSSVNAPVNFFAFDNSGYYFLAQDLDAIHSDDDAEFDWITTMPVTTDDVWFSGIFAARQESTSLFDTGDKLRISYSKDGGVTWTNDVISQEVQDEPLNYAGGKHYTFNLGPMTTAGDIHIRVSFDNLNGGAEAVGCDDFKLYCKCPVQISKRGYTVCNGATYDAYIPYTGSSAAAMTVTPNAGTATFDFNAAEGEIAITGIAVGTDWSVDIAGGCESTTVTGLSPATCLASTTCPATPVPPAVAITISQCITEATPAAQDALAAADLTGATPFATWSGAVAFASTNGFTDIVFEEGNYDRGTWGGTSVHNLDITGLNVYGNGSTIDGNGDGGTMQEAFAILAANDITFYDLHIRDFMHTAGGAIQINGQTGIRFVRCIFDANDYGSDGVVITGGQAEFYCSQFINHIHEPGLGTSSAMSITGGDIYFVDTDWSCNRRVGFGGALKITNAPNVSFYGGSFSDNYTFSGNAGDGGAFYMGGGNLYMDGTSFTCNKSMNGVGISGGGAIRLDAQNTMTTNIVNAYFSTNTDEGGGSPSGGYGGAINIGQTPADPHTAVVAHSTFIENSAGRGGAIYIDSEVDAAILACTIDNNTSNDEGGAGVFVKAGESAGVAKTEFTLWNSEIINNNSSDANQAGGVHVQQAETSINTTASSEDDINIGGNTICGNSSGNAAADYSVHEDMEGTTGPGLRSTEFFGNNNIGTGRAYNDISGEDYSFGCTAAASVAAAPCAGCTTIVAAVASCGGSICGTAFVDNFAEGSQCNNDGTAAGTLTCDPDIAAPVNTDSGLQNVTVQLFECVGGCDGAAVVDGVDTQYGVDVLTDADGNYCFTSLPDATYYVVFTTPAGYTATTENSAGTSGNNDSDNSVTLGVSQSMTVDGNAGTPAAPPTADATSGYADYPNVDAGFYQPYDLSGVILIDTDGNNAGDAPFTAVAVTVTATLAGPDGICGNGDDTTMSTMSSTVDGSYSISGIAPGGLCSVAFTVPSGYSAIDPETGNAIGDGDFITIDGEDICPACALTGTGALIPSGSTATSITGLALNNFALPVELTSFDVRQDNCSAVLSWSTATEENSAYFEVQSSTNGRDFATIERLEAAGNSAETIAYSFTDRSVGGNTYYRLKMVDLDQTFEYSSTILYLADGCGNEISISNLYPNPAKGQLFYSMQSSKNRNMTVAITDVTGRIVYIIAMEANKGENVQELNVSTLASGVYFVKAISKDGFQSEAIKFIKL